MACRLFGTKPLSKPMPASVNWSLRNKRQWNFNQNAKFSFTNMHPKILSARWPPFYRGKLSLAFLVYHRLSIYCRWKNDIIGSTSSENWTWWRHQMETFSALLAICAGNSTVTGKFPHKGQWRGALMFSLICVWINGWVNNRDAGDLRRHLAHYDVIVMKHW